jgi:uncharacterized membrane protein YbhN (UPF0104 family)
MSFKCFFSVGSLFFIRMTKKSSSALAGYIGLGLGIILIVLQFRQIDFAGVIVRISSIGFSSIIILLPFLALHILETLAWIRVFPPSITIIPFFKLLKIQLIAETVSMTLPAGVAIGEPLRPFLCSRFIGIPLPAGVASVAVRKLMLGLAQGVYTIIGAIAGFSLLQTVSIPMLPVGVLGYIMLGTGALVFLLFLLFLLLLLNGNAAQYLHRLLMFVPFRRVKTWLLTKEEGFLDTDEELRSFDKPFAGRLIFVMLIYILAWFMLAIESYIILRLLKVEISFLQVLAMDTAITMLRALFFFIPSGLGVQELGYRIFFQALGMHDFQDYGAFVLLRRFKELLWYTFGYVIMFFSGVHLSDAEGARNEES